jgi:hypothetical protein
VIPATPLTLLALLKTVDGFNRNSRKRRGDSAFGRELTNA